MQRGFASFHWGENWELLPRQICQLPLSEGGLSTPNVPLLASSFYLSRFEKVPGATPNIVDPWIATLVWNMGFAIRDLNESLNSNKFRRRLLPDQYHSHIRDIFDDLKAKPDYKAGIWNAKSHRKIYELLLNRNPPPIVSRLQIVNWKTVFIKGILEMF